MRVEERIARCVAELTARKQQVEAAYRRQIADIEAEMDEWNRVLEAVAGAGDGQRNTPETEG